MTTIAWDGKTLAADGWAVRQDLKLTVDKAWAHKNPPPGRVGTFALAVTGNYSFGLALRRWWLGGASPTSFPKKHEENTEGATLIVITPSLEIHYYDGEPDPIIVHEPFHAWGSGRDFALAAMHMGKTAEKAVELAHHFGAGCGPLRTTIHPGP